MLPLAKAQVEINTKTARYWDSYGTHRARVTELLLRAASPGARLGIMGAGNCNDLDLRALSGAYQDIWLADIDSQAMTRGLSDQADRHPSIRTLSIDLTGAMETIQSWSPDRPIAVEDLRACAEWPDTYVRPALPAASDVIASTCLLSQLIASVLQAIGDGHPQLVDAIGAVRTGHLRLLLGATAAGGRSILISDIVSSDTCPALFQVAPEKLSELVTECIERRNFFHGVNPSVLVSVLRTDPALSSQVARIVPSPAWLWDIDKRRYAVCAITCHRRN